MIYSIIILPIETIIDWFFGAIYSFVSKNIIVAIAGVSLCVNFLALPLYNIADRIQDEERKTVNKLSKWVNHIKRTFKGDERFMMLSEYYRQNHYHPILALRSTFSLLIQIPFFIAAYHYLKTSNLLSGSSFWFIKDLGSPDALISFSIFDKHFVLNILPIIMTLINYISGAIYTKNLTFKEKMQISIITGIFLILLYNAPSGLVIYWILNNVFSLVKNLIKKTKDKTVTAFCLLGLFLLIISHWFINRRINYKSLILLGFSYAFVFILPILWIILTRKKSTMASAFYLAINSLMDSIKKEITQSISVVYSKMNFISCVSLKHCFIVFLLSCIGLTMLCGLVLPSNVIATNPIEFSFSPPPNPPLSFIISNLLFSIGFFAFWPIIFYKFSNPYFKRVFSVLLFSLFLCTILNVFIFKSNYGILDNSLLLHSRSCLKITNSILFWLPLFCFILFFIFLLLIPYKFKKIILYSITISMMLLSTANIIKINSIYSKYYNNYIKYAITPKDDKPIEFYHLSKTGKNVIVFFIDKAIGPWAGDIFKKYPEIENQFKGFVWYPNTLSFSSNTLQGAPPLYGGYEYTPEEFNLRKTELNRNIHNESIMIMPLLFFNNGFKVIISDPAFPNYSTKGDLSAFDSYPNIEVKEIEGLYYNNFLTEKNLVEEQSVNICNDRLINFSLLQMCFPSLRQLFYSITTKVFKNDSPNIKTVDGISIINHSTGMWLRSFSHLYYLPQLTDFKSSQDSFICIHSMAAHDAMVTPEEDLESIIKKEIESDDYLVNSFNWTKKHFLVNAAVYRQIGNFLDYLRENNVYDNTRIIVVSDHGEGNYPWGSLWIEQNPYLSENNLINRYSALLLFKDFYSYTPVTIDNTFMTNADSIFLAKSGLNISNKNPITGKLLKQNKDYGINIYPTLHIIPEALFNDYEFDLDKSKAWHVLDNIYDEKNWFPLLDWENGKGSGK